MFFPGFKETPIGAYTEMGHPLRVIDCHMGVIIEVNNSNFREVTCHEQLAFYTYLTSEKKLYSQKRLVSEPGTPWDGAISSSFLFSLSTGLPSTSASSLKQSLSPYIFVRRMIFFLTF